ncbi:MAG: hypothetical protein CFE23_08430 [Flavobacterium sp. BFFFF1]|uniref:hypothetical protein n=1 Tax=Flavobacterium sp. BFFFF1 TaxID=2015557 RepID=UPI000BCDB1BC|nr:hypothetical protein [Flavobacterium sp. BFFFF1]OYU80506.1 MAG: hypothetical protein CFE23_08430 [Flavobacterium sp. BFFFF1]
MKFKKGDRVELTEERNYPEGDKLPKGSKGTVTEVYEYDESYDIDFDDSSESHEILEKYLKRA